MIYTWKINNLKKQNDPSIELDDIIVEAFWVCTGTDEDGVQGTFYGTSSFQPDTIDPENFTAFEDLTEEQVIGWVQDKVDSDLGYKSYMESHIQKQIDAIVNPVTDVGGDQLPWADPISPPIEP
jgi:hypothetical protein